jgi:hypothetical protein
VTADIAEAVVQDTAGNDNTAAMQFSRIYDAAIPAVSSIVRAGADPTNSSSVDFTVTFSEGVTGVDATDFALTTTGVSGAFVSGVSGSGDSYTVTVDTGTGDGTIRVDVSDDDTILDAASNPLGGAGAGNGDYTAGDLYTIDKTAPTVSMSSVAPDPTDTSPIPVTVTFSEPVTGFATEDITAGNGSVSNLSGSGADYGFDLTPSDEGLVTVDIAAAVVQDAAGNDNTAAAQFSRTYVWHPVPATGEWAVLALIVLLSVAGAAAAARAGRPCRS